MKKFKLKTPFELNGTMYEDLDISFKGFEGLEFLTFLEETYMDGILKSSSLVKDFVKDGDEQIRKQKEINEEEKTYEEKENTINSLLLTGKIKTIIYNYFKNNVFKFIKAGNCQFTKVHLMKLLNQEDGVDIFRDLVSFVMVEYVVGKQSI